MRYELSPSFLFLASHRAGVERVSVGRSGEGLGTQEQALMD